MTDRYRRLEELGRGGFGRVIRAFDRALRREVAIKEVLRDTPWHADHLLHEARLLAWLDHPGVVPVHDVQGAEAVTLAVLEGQTLAQRLASGRPPAPVEALRILRRVAETLANAHDKGVLHLDLKPANVMLRSYGRVVVLDWGAARFHDPAPYAAHLARGGERVVVDRPTARSVGTLAYMAPEQALGDLDALGPWTDVYAAGLLAYELLTGVRPFPDADKPAAVAFTRASPPAPVTAHRPALSPALADLVGTLLSPDPADRPPSFHAVLASLDTLASPVAARPTRTLADGEVLLEVGDPGDVAWQVVDGTVEVYVGPPGAPTVLGRRRAGEVVGELSLLTGHRRSANVRAVGTATVRPVTVDDLDAELARVDPLVATMVRHLAGRLRQSVPSAEVPDLAAQIAIARRGATARRVVEERIDRVVGEQLAGAPGEPAVPAALVPAVHAALGVDGLPAAERAWLLGIVAARVRRALVADGRAVRLHDALVALAERDPVQAALAERVVFGGLDAATAGAHLDLPAGVAAREWAMARAWIRRALTRGA